MTRSLNGNIHISNFHLILMNCHLLNYKWNLSVYFFKGCNFSINGHIFTKLWNSNELSIAYNMKFNWLKPFAFTPIFGVTPEYPQLRVRIRVRDYSMCVGNNWITTDFSLTLTRNGWKDKTRKKIYKYNMTSKDTLNYENLSKVFRFEFMHR